MSGVEGYEVLAVLAETPTARLVRARPRGEAGTVVLKVLASGDPAPDEVARLRHECAIAGDLSPDAVVHPDRVERAGRNVRLVMADTGGRPLAGVIEPGGLAVPTFLRLARALVDSVRAVHGAEVVHRDIKPANILVDDALTSARLIDFGVATRIARTHAEPAAPAQLVGTLAYMAPEQTGRMNRSVDHRCDLYAVGVTLYQMLTGRLPFPAKDALELVHAHLAVTPAAPNEVDPSIPAGLSQLVLRLLAKSPEDRYQSADGLAHDLALAAEAWEATGTVPPMRLGTRDVSGRLELPGRLYGRDDDVATLAATVGEVAQGRKALVLLSGTAGIGKTALVGELHAPVAEHGGRFLTGKFDQFSRDVPYASLAQAFGGLVRQLLAEPPEAAARWRDALTTALAPNVAVVADVIPELRSLLGDVAPAPALGPVEAQNRFNFVFSRFVEVFTGAGRPLTVFLDDLHWADAASLKLLGVLLADPELSHLLVVGAYRPAEVSQAHPLKLALDALPPGLLRHLEVGPLTSAVVADLIADTIDADAAEAAPLAGFLHDRSGGNPFFLGQLLHTAADAKLIHLEDGRWRWDLDGIRAHVVTDDVVDFMIGRLAGLGSPCLAVLQFASLIGNRFALDLLARALDQPSADAAAALWPAIRTGLVLPLDSNHELVGAGLTGASVTYRFLHDRVQQACHATIPPAELPGVHRRVAALLQELADDDEYLFEIVDHLNTAEALSPSGSPDPELTRLNLRAAGRAKSSTAFAAAAAHAAVARAHEPADAWTTDYEQTYAGHSLHGEVLALLNRIDEAESVFEVLLDRSRTDEDRALAWAARGDALFVCNRIGDALEAFKSGLTTLGIPLDYSPAETAAVLARLREPSAIARLRCTGTGGGPAALANRLFGMASITTYMLLSPDCAYFTGRGVEHIISSGCFSQSGLSIVFLGMELARTGHLDLGVAYAEAAVALLEQGDDPTMHGIATMFAWAYCLLWTHDVDAYLRLQRDLFWVCQNGGAMVHANYAIVWEFMAVFSAGRDPVVLLDVVDRADDHGRRYAPQLVGMWPLFRDAALELIGGERPPFDRRGGIAALLDFNIIAAWVALTDFTWHSALMGDHEYALELSSQAGALRDRAGGTPTTHALLSGEIGTVVSATRLALRAPDPRSQADLLALAEQATDRLHVIVDVPPHAYAAFGSLARAAVAEARGDRPGAATMFLRAADEATERDYPLVAGMAHELLGRMYADQNLELANVHLREACASFLRCRATGKADLLEREFPVIQTGGAGDPDGPADPLALDLATVLRVSRLISAEVDEDRVVRQMQAVAVDLTGAAAAVYRRPDDPEAPDSSLEIPIARNERAAGTLHLHHPDGPSALAADGVALLNLLSAQMAISLENARLYANLEAQVAERNSELADTLRQLELMQDQIVTSEKLAALGGLVAGVAHEIDSPVGVAVTATSHLAARVAEFDAAAAAGPLRRSSLESFLRHASEAGELILANLTRAAELVQSFKQVAVDSSSEARRAFGARAYLEQVVASLRPQLVAAGHEVTVDCDAELVLDTYPGALSQVVTNLVLNSVVHGYPGGGAGHLHIAVRRQGENVRLVYTDDGVGIRQEMLASVFEPFVTTRRNEGGSGLGLHIVRNLVTHQLGGTVSARDTHGSGASFAVEIPAVLGEGVAG